MLLNCCCPYPAWYLAPPSHSCIVEAWKRTAIDASRQASLDMVVYELVLACLLHCFDQQYHTPIDASGTAVMLGKSCGLTADTLRCEACVIHSEDYAGMLSLRYH